MTDTAREALERILAMKYEDRQTVHEGNAWPAWQKSNAKICEIFEIARAALASEAPGREPVAWRVRHEDCAWVLSHHASTAETYRAAGWEVEPLYAAPVPSETQGLREAELSSDDLRLIDQAWENHKAALPVATVINNNQPGRTAIIEITIDPPTLDVGAKLYAEPKAITIATPSPAPGLVEAAEWQPIKTAPKGIKVLGGFYNALGNWRTVTARYYETETLESEDEETGFAPAGWYEESETHETILPIKLEFWLPLPLRARAPGGVGS